MFLSIDPCQVGDCSAAPGNHFQILNQDQGYQVRRIRQLFKLFHKRKKKCLCSCSKLPSLRFLLRLSGRILDKEKL